MAEMVEVQISKVEADTLRPALSWHVVALFVTGSVALFSRFFRANTLGFFEDDFFYYVQIARNLALHGLSSFDGIHLTNGYHPLWLLLLALLYSVSPAATFFIAVEALSLLLLIVFYFAVSKCLASMDVACRYRNYVALLLSLHALLLFRFGMEVTLALPLGMLLLAYVLSRKFRWTGRRTFVYGLLAACTVLARLDAALFVALLLCGQTLFPGSSSPPWSKRLFHLLVFLIGFSPFFLYLLSNEHWFHILLPISGYAKQLKPLFPLSSTPIRSLLLPPDRTKAVYVLPALLLLGFGLLRFQRIQPYLDNRKRVVFFALLFFPLTHFLTLAMLSDWAVWPWYFYSLTFSSVASLAILLRSNPQRAEVFPVTRVLQFVCACYAFYFLVYAVKKTASPLVSLAEDVRDFSANHPGIYAMGDGAGSPAYLSPQPFLQLEGLVMDKAYLKDMKVGRPLAQVLHEYHARYYILLNAPKDGCFWANEPGQAGPHSPHMQGEICDAAKARFTSKQLSLSIYDADAVR